MNLRDLCTRIEDEMDAQDPGEEAVKVTRAELRLLSEADLVVKREGLPGLWYEHGCRLLIREET